MNCTKGLLPHKSPQTLSQTKFHFQGSLNKLGVWISLSRGFGCDEVTCVKRRWSLANMPLIENKLPLLMLLTQLLITFLSTPKLLCSVLLLTISVSLMPMNCNRLLRCWQPSSCFVQLNSNCFLAPSQIVWNDWNCKRQGKADYEKLEVSLRLWLLWSFVSWLIWGERTLQLMRCVRTGCWDVDGVTIRGLRKGGEDTECTRGDKVLPCFPVARAHFVHTSRNPSNWGNWRRPLITLMRSFQLKQSPRLFSDPNLNQRK